jgi:carboxymethylenebutenolidase
MKQRFKALLGISVLVLFSAVLAARVSRALKVSAQGAVKPKTQTVQFPSGKETVDAFLATPDSSGRHPGIIVIHEWWGLNDWVKEETVKLAEQGYVALAVDLYRGKVAADSNEAHELYRGLPQDRGVQDLLAAFDYLGARADVNKDRIGSIGWCMGGGFSIQLAVHQPHLAACVVNYGALPTGPNDIQQIYPPVLGNFGGKDRGITPADVQAFEKSMRSMGKRIDVKIYPDAGHAFENPNNKDGYRPEDAQDAWTRTINFFNHTLR